MDDLVEVRLSRIVIREDSDRQYIFVTEREGERGFPIVIGTAEAIEIHRVVRGVDHERPLTHELTSAIITGLGAKLLSCDIVALKQNTFYALLRLENDAGEVEIDARPSDAIALSLRAGGRLRVAEEVLNQVRPDQGPELPETDA